MSKVRKYSQCAIAVAALVGLSNTSARATLQVLENFTPGGTGGDLAGYSSPQEIGLSGTWMNMSGTAYAASGNTRSGSTIYLSAANGENGYALVYPTNSSLSSSNPTGGSAVGVGGYPNPLYVDNLTNSIPLSGTAGTYYFSFLTDNKPGSVNYNSQVVLSSPSTQIYAGIGYNGNEDVSVVASGNLPFGGGNSYTAAGKSFSSGFSNTSSGNFVGLVLGELVVNSSGVDTVNLSTFRYAAGSSAPLPTTASSINWDISYQTPAETDTLNQLGLMMTGGPVPEIDAIRIGTTYADVVGTVTAVGLAGTYTTYTGAVNGSWDTSTQNFSFNGSSTAFATGNNVLFDDTATGPHNVVVTSGGVSPGSVTFNNATTAYNISGGPVTSPGALTLVGAGTVTLGASNSYAGGVNLTNGTLVLGAGSLLNTGSFAVGTGVLSFNGGTLQASNNSAGFISGVSLSIQAGGGTIDTQAFNVTIADAFSPSNTSPGGGLTKIGSGTLTLSSPSTYTGTTVVNAGTLNLATGGGTGAVRGNIVINAGATVDATAGDALGYGIGSSVPTLTVNSGGTFILDAGNNNEGYTTNLVVNGGTVTSTNGGGFNFSDGYNISSGASATTGTISSPIDIRQTGITITTAAGTTPSGIDLLLSGGLVGYSSNPSVTFAGNGTVDVTAIGSYGGGTTISGGTVIAGNTFAFGNPSPNINISGTSRLVLGSLTSPAPAVNFSLNYFDIMPGSLTTLQLNPTASFSSGTIGYIEIGGSGTKVALTIGSTPATGVTTGLLTISSLLQFDDATSTLDIGSVAVDLAGGAGQSVSSVSALVSSGFANGKWTGPGVTSSAAASDTKHLTAVGVIVNDNGSGTPLYGNAGSIAATFEGGAPSDGDVLLKYTYFGDANLDGKVDGTDYGRIDAAYIADLTNPGSVTGWFNGDFNYDGVVNGSDYTLIDNAFNTQGAVYTAIISSPLATSTAEIGSSAVPEPTILGLFGFAAVGVSGRRRRR